MLKNLVIYTLAFAIIYGSFILFRLYYFEDFYPNTYYGKQASSYYDLSNTEFYRLILRGLYQLLNSFTASPGDLFFAVLIAAATYYLLVIKKFTQQHLVIVLFLSISIGVYILLPSDWMKEFRFATPFYVFIYSYLLIFGASIIKTLKWTRFGKNLLGSILVVTLVGSSVPIFIDRTLQFHFDPTVPFKVVAREYGHKFNKYAQKLNLKQASLPAPDLGGTLYYSNLKIYDLAALTDKTITKTLMAKPRQYNAFYNYVFEDIKPTFIHIHAWFTGISRFDKDKRFQRDYLPINEYTDSYLLKSGLQLYSGDYI